MQGVPATGIQTNDGPIETKNLSNDGTLFKEYILSPEQIFVNKLKVKVIDLNQSDCFQMIEQVIKPNLNFSKQILISDIKDLKDDNLSNPYLNEDIYFYNLPAYQEDASIFYINNWNFKKNETFFSKGDNMNDQPNQFPNAYSQGVPAQGNINPQAAFFNHALLKVKDKIYDPSYGTKFSSLVEWETNSITGFGCTICDKAGLTEQEKEDKICWDYKSNSEKYNLENSRKIFWKKQDNDEQIQFIYTIENYKH